MSYWILCVDMAINPSNLTTQSIQADTNVVLEIVYIRPETGVTLSQPMTPNKLFGYYDAARDAVKLYVVDDSGLTILPVS